MEYYTPTSKHKQDNISLIQPGDKSGDQLGSTTEFASQTSSQRNWRNKTVSKRYYLQDVSRALLPLHRINACMKVPLMGTGRVEVWKDTNSGHAHIKGVGRCGTYWVCPVCAAKISLGRRNELQEGMSKARAKGWYPVLVTFTSRHSRDDNLADTVKKTRKAQRNIKSGRWWQDNVKAYGLKGTITGIEVTYGHQNGWHVHFHAVYLFEKFVNIKDLETKLFHRWYAALQRQGLDCDRDHGVIALPGNAAAAYVTKWGIENEVANPSHKAARKGHFSPFDLLEQYDKGHKWAGKLFREFAAAFKGVSQMRWSKGLRAVLDMGDAVTDEELAEEETSENSVRVVSMTWKQYKYLCAIGGKGIIGRLLTTAELGSDAVILWLKHTYDIDLVYQ